MDKQKLAAAIAKELFTNGQGQEARRIVLELEDERNGGGWSQPAAKKAVERVIDKFEQEAQ